MQVSFSIMAIILIVLAAVIISALCIVGIVALILFIVSKNKKSKIDEKTITFKKY